LAGSDQGRDAFVGNVLEVALASGQRLGLGGIHVKTQHLQARLARRDANRQSDIAKPDHADQSRLLSKTLAKSLRAYFVFRRIALHSVHFVVRRGRRGAASGASSVYLVAAKPPCDSPRSVDPGELFTPRGGDVQISTLPHIG